MTDINIIRKSIVEKIKTIENDPTLAEEEKTRRVIMHASELGKILIERAIEERTEN